MTIVDKIMEHAKKIDPGCSDKWKEAYMTGVHDAVHIMNTFNSLGAIERRLIPVIEATEPYSAIYAYCHSDNNDLFTEALAKAVINIDSPTG